MDSWYYYYHHLAHLHRVRTRLDSTRGGHSCRRTRLPTTTPPPTTTTTTTTTTATASVALYRTADILRLRSPMGMPASYLLNSLRPLVTPAPLLIDYTTLVQRSPHYCPARAFFGVLWALGVRLGYRSCRRRVLKGVGVGVVPYEGRRRCSGAFLRRPFSVYRVCADSAGKYGQELASGMTCIALNFDLTLANGAGRKGRLRDCGWLASALGRDPDSSMYVGLVVFIFVSVRWPWPVTAISEISGRTEHGVSRDHEKAVLRAQPMQPPGTPSISSISPSSEELNTVLVKK